MMLDLSKVKFDQDVTTVQLIFSEKPTLLNHFEKDSFSVTDILENKNTKTAVYDLANLIHNGSNIMDHSGLTNDGLEMTLPKTSKTTPETLKWISKHAEALFETGKGLPGGHYSGMSALSKDRQTIYLFVEGTPTGPVALKGIKNNIARIRIAGEGSILDHKIYNKLYWSQTPGIIYINIPKERLDKSMTVLAILLDKPVELYREKVGSIENNL